MSFIPTITPKEAALKMKSENFILLDVREDAELEFVKIEGSLNIPMRQVPSRINEIDSSKEIGVLCLGGGRSGKVAGFLIQQGFTEVKNIAGGIKRYSDEVDLSLAKYKIQKGNLIPL